MDALLASAVIAESRRIHRSNSSVWEFYARFVTETRITHGLTGFETYEIEGMSERLKPREMLTVRARSADGSEKTFRAVSRIDTPEEMSYYRHGGILPYVLRQLVGKDRS